MPRFDVAKTVPLIVLLFAVAGLRAQDSSTLLSQASAESAAGNSQRAAQLLDQAIEKDATLAFAYYLRGRERFRLGQIRPSVADFDRFVELRPNAESRQWERGISYYYAGEFTKGAKQFESCQTFYDNDVENSVWRYLCIARTDGVEKARETMLPIENDSRIPMMAIYDLYRGKLEPDDVLKAARVGEPDAESLNERLFYAHLYLGLFYEAAGDKPQAKSNLEAAERLKIGHYMWDVAHVHVSLLRDR